MAHVVVEDGFAVVAILVLAVSLGLSVRARRRRVAQPVRIEGVGLHVLALASVAGAIMMAQANDLVVVFLGLEIMSIGLYVLAAFDRRSRRSGEAALKYFLLGGFSSAIFVYGIALVYGATGTTQLGQLSDFLARNVLHNQGLLLRAPRCCSSASASRSPPSRSTPGPPTSTRARRPRWSGSWRRS